MCCSAALLLASRVFGGPREDRLRDPPSGTTRFDQRNGTFDVDLEAWAKWLGDFDPSALRVANESDLERDDLGGEDDAGWYVRRWRTWGRCAGVCPSLSLRRPEPRDRS
ncbi:MAG: hypothetical protein U0326_30895 [Polyangiales bacterium]